MRTIGFFNNKGGVGKTTLVYHLSWMLRELGLSVVAVDLDPQANLTASFLDDDSVEKLWSQPHRERGCAAECRRGPVRCGHGRQASALTAG